MESHTTRYKLQPPRTFPAFFEYQFLRYLSHLSPSELLSVCSVAKAWHKHAMAVFWDNVFAAPCFTNEATQACLNIADHSVLSRALIHVVSYQNAYTISRIDYLLTQGVNLNAMCLGRFQYSRPGPPDENKTLQTLDNPTPLAVAACLAEENGPYGAAIVKHLVEKLSEIEDKQKPVSMLNLSSQLLGLINNTNLVNNKFLLAFLRQRYIQQEEKQQAEKERDVRDSYTHGLSETEEIIMGFGVLLVPAMILCALLAPPIITITIMSVISVPGLLSLLLCACSGRETLMLVLFFSSLAVVGSAGITMVLASMVGSFVCGMSLGLAALAIAASLYTITGESIQSRKKREVDESYTLNVGRDQREFDAKQFKIIAESAMDKCSTEPQPIATFSGGLFLTLFPPVKENNADAALTKENSNSKVHVFSHVG